MILHDACYGHRYSRPRTSRAHLRSIVERPERIKACVLGVAAAYVRLGERHQDGSFPVSPDTDVASLPSIPFRIQKSGRRLSLASQTVTNVHGTKWMDELRMMCDTAEAKLATGGKELQRPDIDRGPNADTPQKFHEGDLYLCAESLDALEGALGGVCDAVDAVFTPQGPQRAFVAIRPPGHHCSASHPSGFCWINNVHVGIMHAILSHGLTHAAIIDFDLHHGDGSQSIAWQHNARSVGLAKNAAWWKKTSIGYFSLHDINSYPCEAGDEDKVRNASVCIDGAHGQSVWNIHLQPWKTEADFWVLYESKYSVLLEKMRSYLRSHTERLKASGLNSRAAIFISAGFDASEWEDPAMQRHNVNVPTEFYARFTRDIVRIAAEEGTSVEGRIISVLEGGYSDRALYSGVFSHLCGLAGDGPSNKDQELTGLGHDSQRIGLRARKDSSASERGARRYESSWWSPAELERLEATMTAPPTAPKLRNCTPPTYSSPTQASAAKVVTPKNPKRRSMSGLSPSLSHPSPPPPPPPDVPWTVATHEFSKLLIPSGRQTDSCTPEDLNAEATRARRERQAALASHGRPVGIPAVPEERPSTRMGLRERKPKQAPVVDDDDDPKSRRRTVAGPVLATEPATRGPNANTGRQPRASSRRLSVASTVLSSGSVDSAPPVSDAASTRGSSKAPSVNGGGLNGKTLNVKKSRAPAKKEPAPRASRASKKADKATNEAASQAASLASSSDAPSAEKNGDAVDNLAKEMKKIKITVITKAQKEAREQERAAREQPAKAETVSVPSAPDISPAAAAAPAPEQLPSPAPSSPQQPPPADTPVAQPANPATPSAEVAKPPGLASPPDTDPVRVRLPASSPPPAQNGEEAVFIPYQPDGPPPKSVAQHHQQQEKQHQHQQALQWLPPNVSGGPGPGPSPVKKEDLPVFTSTSVIPFAPAGQDGGGGKGEADERESG